MFGQYGKLPLSMFVLGICAVLVVIAFILLAKDLLILGLFSPELAAATGVRLSRMNLMFLLILSLTVLISLQFMGALLAGALVMLPAAIGRRLAHDLNGFLIMSALSSIVSVVIGLCISALTHNHVPPGGAATMSAARLFGFTLLRPAR